MSFDELIVGPIQIHYTTRIVNNSIKFKTPHSDTWILKVVTQREPRAWPCYADHGLYRYLNLLEGLHTPITCYHLRLSTNKFTIFVFLLINFHFRYCNAFVYSWYFNLMKIFSSVSKILNFSMFILISLNSLSSGGTRNIGIILYSQWFMFYPNLTNIFSYCILPDR